MCEICGTFNFKENNYCTHCGNKLIIEHICPYCGETNLDSATHCVKCQEQINPIAINDFDTLFTEYNHDLLLNAQISEIDYLNLVSALFMRADYFDIQGDTIKNKILNFAGIFTECKPKARGYERGYIFLRNCIYYDDRLDDSVQISTIIHELGHYFLFSIVEQVLCSILGVQTSSTLQSFVWYFLTLPEFKIMNEYCAHTVEGRFIPFGFQNYGSFNVLVENTPLNQEALDFMVIFGNTFANEIIGYLENYIGEELRDEIKIQYRKDLNAPSYESILKETTDSLPLDLKNSMLRQLLFDIFKEASQEDMREKLEDIKKGMELD